MLCFSQHRFKSQTTGKISGSIIDADTNDPLIAANVIVRDTNLGAATDVEGYYSIVNINLDCIPWLLT